jgi:hypothetical protein
MVWQEVAAAINAVKDALHIEPKPQQEPSYAGLVGLTDPGAAKSALELFYGACKRDYLKEMFLALITNSSKLLSLWLILVFLRDLV